MAEVKDARRRSHIRSVPIAVSPQGFWCCPFPVVQNTSSKEQHTLSKLPKFPDPKAQISKPAPARHIREAPGEKFNRCYKKEEVEIAFGEKRSSCDTRLVLQGKNGFRVNLNVHKDVLVANSTFFSHKFTARGMPACGPYSLEIDDCHDTEMYAETVCLMYCRDMKNRLMKENVARVLRVVKVAESLGFQSCIQSCLDYLEAVPWEGEEDEQMVISSVVHLENDVSPILKRVLPHVPSDNKETFSKIIELVLNSRDRRSGREMKQFVLQLLEEENIFPNSTNLWSEMIHTYCRNCISTLLTLFRQASATDTPPSPSQDMYDSNRIITLETDNLSWLLDILILYQDADDFSVMWAKQQELASLHANMEIVMRCHLSFITAQLLVRMGNGKILPSMHIRKLLLKTWLQPLMKDYSWLQNGYRPLNQKAVEEGIGHAILTLPLEDQRNLLHEWLASFLNTSADCPDLRRALEIWWRRTFRKPYTSIAASSSLSLVINATHDPSLGLI